MTKKKIKTREEFEKRLKEMKNVSSLYNLQVTKEDGPAIENATVTLYDKDGNEIFSVMMGNTLAVVRMLSMIFLN